MHFDEGDLVVTVGRDGPDHDRFGNGIYTTKVYVARRRRDGVLTWRLRRRLRGHRTAGKGVTEPMRRRAKDYAAGRGVAYLDEVRHGTPVRTDTEAAVADGTPPPEAPIRTTNVERTRELLAAEQTLSRLHVDHGIQIGGIQVRRVLSPFGDGPRFFVFRGVGNEPVTWTQLRVGSPGPDGRGWDDYHSLTEAALAYLEGRRVAWAADRARAPANLRASVQTAMEKAVLAGLEPAEVYAVLLDLAGVKTCGCGVPATHRHHDRPCCGGEMCCPEANE